MAKKVYKNLMALEMRNALAHSFFPENRRIKPSWKGADIFSKTGFDQFWDDMSGLSDFFMKRMARLPPEGRGAEAGSALVRQCEAATLNTTVSIGINRARAAPQASWTIASTAASNFSTKRIQRANGAPL